jgi:hypothetical protein
LEAHLKAKNQWAAELQATLQASQARVVELQDSIAEREIQIAGEQQRAIEVITRLEATVIERTEWAQASDKQVDQLTGALDALSTQSAELKTELGLVRESRWVKLGNALGVGPKVRE